MTSNVLAFATVFAVAVLLNFPWEMGQSFLFAPTGTTGIATWRCFVASLGDGVMILAIVAAGWLVFGTSTWFVMPRGGRLTFMIAAAIVLGVAVEWWGLYTGRWAYQASMPLVPLTKLGVVPLVQLPVLTPLTLALSPRWFGRRQPKG